jgi:hypothetical protein
LAVIGAVISSARRHALAEELPLPSDAVDTFVSNLLRVAAKNAIAGPTGIAYRPMRGGI